MCCKVCSAVILASAIDGMCDGCASIAMNAAPRARNMARVNRWVGRVRTVESVARKGSVPASLVADNLAVAGDELGMALAMSRGVSQGNIFTS